MNFNYSNTTKVYFTDTLKQDLSDFLTNNGFKRIMLLTGNGKTKEIAVNLKQDLHDFFECELLSGITTNPLCETVTAMSIKTKEFKPDIVITIGGGSVHDAGKAVALLYYNVDNVLEDYTVTGKLSVPGIKKVLPVITIPTLFGSGAEVSPAALIRIGNEKKVIFSPLLHPIATFVHVDYCTSLSKQLIARSAYDSLIQAVEGYISLKANNISNAFAITTIEYFNNCYENLVKGEFDKDVLEKLAIASMFSSYVCSTASVGAIHALSDPLSGRYNIHHGTALAMVTIKVLEKNFSVIEESKLCKLCTMLSNIPSDKEKIIENVLDKFEKIISSLQMLENIERLNVSKGDLNSLVIEAKNPDMDGNPYEFNDRDIFDIFKGL